MFVFLRDVAAFIIRGLAVFVLLAAAAGPLYTYFFTQHTQYLHKLHSEGVPAAAAITGARVTGKDVYRLDLSWPDGRGGTLSAKDVELSSDYAPKVVSRAGISARTVPVKYLASDPASFILTADPRNNEAGRAEMGGWGVIVSLIGLVGGLPAYFFANHINRLAKAEAAAPAEMAKRHHRVGWFVTCLILYGVLLSIHFRPEGYAFNVKAFGAAPFGLPVTLVVTVATAIIFAPFLWVMWHVMLLMFQARNDGGRFGLFYLAGIGQRHPHLRQSRNAAVLGLVYFIGICAVWITYTAMRGI